jgi:tRNA dimethylallyltransferase
MRNFLIVLLGPTGVGKTDISIDLAKSLGCEIISADSRQFFRQMSIGTAVPSDYQLSEVKHHFIRFLSVENYYSSSLFERDVLELLPRLFSSCGFALMAGGSGMYINAVCDGIDDIPDTDEAVRAKYIAMYAGQGIAGLRSALKLLDPGYYSTVDLNNHKRIIRALEISDATGKPYSSFLKKKKRIRDFGIIRIGLQRPREELYERINSRVDGMMSLGLEEEARNLLEYRHLNALNSVGYRELFDYFDGTVSREKAIELIKRNSRRYAKRQMTWWARDKEITWFNPGQYDEIIEYIKKISSESEMQISTEIL